MTFNYQCLTGQKLMPTAPQGLLLILEAQDSKIEILSNIHLQRSQYNNPASSFDHTYRLTSLFRLLLNLNSSNYSFSFS